MSMGLNNVSELWPPRAYCLSPMWYMSMEDQGGVILTGKIEKLWKTLSQRHFVHHKSHMDWPEREPRPPLWEAGN
jgi:hypothetical protein